MNNPIYYTIRWKRRYNLMRAKVHLHKALMHLWWAVTKPSTYYIHKEIRRPG